MPITDGSSQCRAAPCRDIAGLPPLPGPCLGGREARVIGLVDWSAANARLGLAWGAGMSRVRNTAGSIVLVLVRAMRHRYH